MKASLILGLLVWGLSWRCDGQGFVNLDFEDAQVVVNEPTYGWLDWDLAAPGWNHSSGSSTHWIYYGHEHLGADQIYLLMDATSPVTAPGSQLDGQYSLAFASGSDVGPSLPYPWVNAFISQTGIVPASSRSLQMLAAGPFKVVLGGTEISMSSLGGNLYGGDISSVAGVTAELKIMNTSPLGSVHVFTIVDDIVFSPTPVPEPASLALLLCGSMALCKARGGRGRTHRWRERATRRGS